MKLFLEKTYLNLKMISWKFIVPMMIAIILSTIALVVVIAQHNLIAIVITSLTLLGFLGLLIGLYMYNWIKYFKHIKYKVNGLYIIPNQKYKESKYKNHEKIEYIIQSLISYGANICGAHGFLIFPKEIKNAINNTIVIIVDDLNVEGYNERWGTNYKGLAGLMNGNAVYIVYNDKYESLYDTALEYELNRVWLAKMQNKMSVAQWSGINNKLGIGNW